MQTKFKFLVNFLPINHSEAYNMDLFCNKFVLLRKMRLFVKVSELLPQKTFNETKLNRHVFINKLFFAMTITVPCFSIITRTN